jgi:hypothetical protein
MKYLSSWIASRAVNHLSSWTAETVAIQTSACEMESPIFECAKHAAF